MGVNDEVNDAEKLAWGVLGWFRGFGHFFLKRGDSLDLVTQNGDIFCVLILEEHIHVVEFLI